MTQLWDEPEHPNLAAALAGYVGAGAPLIAGFELAAVATMLTSDKISHKIPLAGPTVIAMVTSASLMVFSIRYAFWAVSYWTTPAERLMWNPAAAASLGPLSRERRRLAGRMAYFRTLRRRAENLFELGLITFVLAVMLVLVPAHWQTTAAGWRWAALGVAAFSLLIHVLWSAGRWLHAQAGRWRGALRRRSQGQDDAWQRAAMRVSKADRRLVKGLALIWPPARPAEFEEPGPPDRVSLAGLGGAWARRERAPGRRGRR